MYYFTAIERFDPGNGERWVGYTRWLGRTDLKRIVTLDSLICPPVVHVQSSDDWQFVAQEEFMLDFFTSLDFVLRRISGHRPSVVVATARNPSADDVAGFPHPNFELAGFDIVDAQFTASAILNGCNYPGAFNISELSVESGLIKSRERAFRIRDVLHQRYPNRDQTKSGVWAIWRYTGIMDRGA
ncbi:MAG: hypothetical protein WBN75_05100 [Verrucomicrobiia bacterium]|jgi:hypothetical protein